MSAVVGSVKKKPGGGDEKIRQFLPDFRRLGKSSDKYDSPLPLRFSVGAQHRRRPIVAMQIIYTTATNLVRQLPPVRPSVV